MTGIFDHPLDSREDVDDLVFYVTNYPHRMDSVSRIVWDELSRLRERIAELGGYSD
jgi:hypothetical protein